MSIEFLFLPEEILGNVSIFLRVDELLNFALTCSRFYHHVEARLRRNQQYYDQGRIQHDRLPLTVPTLLRMAMTMRDETWQVRSFDVWDARVQFRDWGNRMFYKSSRSDLWGDPHNHTGLTEDYYTLDEREAFKTFMRKELNLDEDTIDRWSLKIASGWDEPIKGILFALLPKLTNLNFISFQPHYFNTSDFSDAQKHPLTFITQSIQSVMDGLDDGSIFKWPPGFQSLRKISVCTSSPYLHQHDNWFVPASVVAHLFKLPNLKVLHLTLAGQSDLEPEDAWELGPRISNIEELSFFTCRFWGLQTWVRYIAACRKLVSLHINHLDINYGNDLFNTVKDCHGNSIEYLWLECSYQIGLETMAQAFPKLKHLGFFKDTNLLQTHLCHPEMTFRQEQTTHIHAFQKNKRRGNRAPYRIADLCRILPISIETLQLKVESWRFMGDEKLLSLIAIRAELLRAVADLVEDNRFDHLRQVCLYELLGAEYEDPTEVKIHPWRENITYEWDWNAFRRIQARGIETHLHDEEGNAYTFKQHRQIHLQDVYGPGGSLIESDPKLQRSKE